MVKFTKASRKDGDLVTIRTSQISDAGPITQPYVVLKIEGVETLFKTSRGGTTLSTRSFPSRLWGPEVGSPVNYDVSNFFTIDDED